jgi:GT2 family glycosyltransferase
MKALIAIPTITRADLLARNKGFLEALKSPDEALIIDNGNQAIDIEARIERPGRNLGVAGSWNRALRAAFKEDRFDLLVLLQDDIIWNAARLDTAKRLLVEHPDVDLFLSPFQFSVQVHRPRNVKTIGFYDERYYPAWCEDDDYALTMIERGRIYERFTELDPLPGSIANGTEKGVSWSVQKARLVEKWGRDLGINDPAAPYYKTNRGFSL